MRNFRSNPAQRRDHYQEGIVTALRACGVLGGLVAARG